MNTAHAMLPNHSTPAIILGRSRFMPAHSIARLRRVETAVAFPNAVGTPKGHRKKILFNQKILPTMRGS